MKRTKREMFYIALERKYEGKVKSAETSYCCMRVNQRCIGQTNPDRAKYFAQAHEEYEQMVVEEQAKVRAVKNYNYN